MPYGDAEEDYGSFDEEDFVGLVTPKPSLPPSSASKGLQQRTLFGGLAQVQCSQGAASYSATRSRVRNKNEPPTHHRLDAEAIKSWIFPTNYAQRDYQFNMIKKALYTNVLIALPTGLGKTFIAAVVMYNWYRWAPLSKIIFLAPSKPLVTQQIEACYHICGIPARESAELTGGILKGRRMAAYQERRVFFMTPQTFQNDLRSGLIKAEDISCLVIDEAHHATGNYAYVEVVQQMRRQTNSFRILALTATPGKTVETVQEVIDGLNISQIEIRSETAIDIRSYIHTKEIETITIDLSPEMLSVQSKYASLLKPMMQKLISMGVGMTGDPTKVSAFATREAVEKMIRESRGSAGQARYNPNGARTVGAILSSLAYNMELLNTHGIRPFYDAMVELKDNVKGSDNKKRVVNDSKFTSMMYEMKQLLEDPAFSGHPKLDHLTNVLLDHFSKAEEEGNTQTRAMVFSSLRVSAEAIISSLSKHKPLVRPTAFFGQSSGKSGKGMSQKEQMETIKQFKKGIHNVIVATSVGEEGLDIGEIDLIICYDSSSSPARMLQRMGRTGRKRDGHVYVLCVRGKEEMAFLKAKDAHRTMHKKIEQGVDIKLSEDVHRIIPWNVEPECEKRLLQVPGDDNIADRELKSISRKKKEVKTFKMPNGVNQGFVSAASLGTVQHHQGSKKFNVDDELWDFSKSDKGDLLNEEEEEELSTRFQSNEEGETGQCLAEQRRNEGILLSGDELRRILTVTIPSSDTTRRLSELINSTFRTTHLRHLQDHWQDTIERLSIATQSHAFANDADGRSLTQNSIDLQHSHCVDDNRSEESDVDRDTSSETVAHQSSALRRDTDLSMVPISRVCSEDDDDDGNFEESLPSGTAILPPSRKRKRSPSLGTRLHAGDEVSDVEDIDVHQAALSVILPPSRVSLSQLKRDDSDDESLPDANEALSHLPNTSDTVPAPSSSPIFPSAAAAAATATSGPAFTIPVLVTAQGAGMTARHRRSRLGTRRNLTSASVPSRSCSRSPSQSSPSLTPSRVQSQSRTQSQLPSTPDPPPTRVTKRSKIRIADSEDDEDDNE